MRGSFHHPDLLASRGHLRAGEVDKSLHFEWQGDILQYKQLLHGRMIQIYPGYCHTSDIFDTLSSISCIVLAGMFFVALNRIEH